MILADATPYSEILYVPFDGISTIIAAFVVYGRIRPDIVRNRTQYNAVFAALLVIIFCGMLRSMAFNSGWVHSVAGLLAGFAQIVSMIMILACTSGLTIKSLGNELKESAENFRAGTEEKKPVIVPLSTSKPVEPSPVVVPAPSSEPVAPRVRIDLNEKKDTGSIPLEE